MERAALELNRYPDGGAWTLRAKLGAEQRRIPLRDHTYDLEALLAAIGPRTKLVYVCHPNNPTGTANGREELLSFLDGLPEHVLCVLDQAYFEYIDDPDYVDGLDLFREGRRIAVLRTFSKIYGLAGLRVGWAVAPADVATATSKVRRAFDVAATAQAAALASLDDPQEIAQRRQLNAEGRGRLAEILSSHGLEPVGPARGNFLFADVSGGRALFQQLQREGAI